jgi:hypothetical protein
MLNICVTGKDEHTDCFHCGVTLSDWEITDCTLKEYARWSPKSLYVIHIKGKAFVLDNLEDLKTTQAFEELYSTASVVCVQSLSGF